MKKKKRRDLIPLLGVPKSWFRVARRSVSINRIEERRTSGRGRDPPGRCSDQRPCPSDQQFAFPRRQTSVRSSDWIDRVVVQLHSTHLCGVVTWEMIRFQERIGTDWTSSSRMSPISLKVWLRSTLRERDRSTLVLTNSIVILKKSVSLEGESRLFIDLKEMFFVGCFSEFFVDRGLRKCPAGCSSLKNTSTVTLSSRSVMWTRKSCSTAVLEGEFSWEGCCTNSPYLNRRQRTSQIFFSWTSVFRARNEEKEIDFASSGTSVRRNSIAQLRRRRRRRWSLFRFNPSGSFVIGRDEEMLLDVLRIDLLRSSTIEHFPTLSNVRRFEKQVYHWSFELWLRRTLLDGCHSSLFFELISIENSFVHRNVWDLNHRQCPFRTPFRLNKMVFNGSLQKRILDRSLLECDHGNRRNPPRMI